MPSKTGPKTQIEGKTNKTGPKADTVKPIANSELTADYVGFIPIGDLEIGCAVLSDETRVFFQREVLGILTGHRKGNMERYLSPENLRPYVPVKFAGDKWDENVLKFKLEGKIANGYNATDLIDICNMYIKARNDGKLYESQLQLAKQADVIVTAFAKVGVEAVIDEATGYQAHRKKDALRMLVQSYVIEEARKWMKEFPDDFFIELDRIYDNPRTTPRKRPRYYGAFINRYIYEPIEGGFILDKLKELNPADEKGNRRKKLHSFLNETKGIQVLRNRIGKVTALLMVSPNKRKFDDLFNRMEGKSTQLELFDD